MSDNKKYYYLKLKETFFDSEEMKLLESMENGVNYQNLYFRMCLLSLKSEGLLLFKNIIPYDLKMLSTVLRVNIDTIMAGLAIFQQIGLVSKMDNGTIFMADIQSLIGRSSTEAERIRSYREKTKQLKNSESVQMYELCSPELELELEKEIELDKELKKDIETKPKDKKAFRYPELEEIEKYILEKKMVIDPSKFFDWYTKTDWKDNKGKQILNWKNKAVNWDSREKEKNPNKEPYSRTLQPIFKINACPKCGGQILASVCMKCDTAFDGDGKELK